ncbi:MAG: hypothetical protein IPJ82_13040 [Lewinellaceae bacterium]|nr:hypothetical protein [Lewinellaceae bacterium]
MTYEENKAFFTRLTGIRRFHLEETERPNFWIQDNGVQVQILEETVPKSLRIENTRRQPVAFVPMDGRNGMFENAPPPVRDAVLFRYQWFNHGNYEALTAGACDCLLLDTKWRFLELKTEVTTQNENQAAQQREKAMLQLARTITFFKEQAEAQQIEVSSPIEAVMAFPSRFPAEKAVNFNRGPRFFKLFKARLAEVNTDVPYSLD